MRGAASQAMWKGPNPRDTRGRQPKAGGFLQGHAGASAPISSESSEEVKCSQRPPASHRSPEHTDT